MLAQVLFWSAFLLFLLSVLLTFLKAWAVRETVVETQGMLYMLIGLAVAAKYIFG